MFQTLSLIFAVLLVLSFVPFVWITVRGAIRERGPRVITCPENGCASEVEVKTWHSGFTTALGETHHRLANCSRWPEKAGCDQACVTQIEESPNGCLVRSLVAEWYQGRNCAFCASEIPEVHMNDRKPALRTSEGRTLPLSDVEPVHLAEVLATAQAVCANCFDAMSFREQFPGLAVDRPKPEAHPASMHS